MYTIYGLCEPFNPAYYNENCQNPEYPCWWWRFSLYNRLRYIGITDDIYRRFGEHISCRDSTNPRKNDWIIMHKDQQKAIQIETLQHVDSLKIAQIRETYWITYYHYLGSNLLNTQKYQWLPSRECIDYVIEQTFVELKDLYLQRVWNIWSNVYGDENIHIASLKHAQTQQGGYIQDRWPANTKALYRETLSRRTSIQSWKELFEDRI